MESYESNRTKFMISADDFGLSQKANQNILNLIELGKLERVAVMAFGKMSPTEIQRLIKSRVKLDIHLDILHEFEEKKQARTSVMVRGIEFLWKFLTGKLTTKKVATDWENQIKTFQKLFGKNPDGLNSHEHVHLFPPFFKIALQLREKYSIPYIRFGDSVFVIHHKLIAYLLHFLRKFNLGTCKKYSCVSSGSLISLDWLSDIEAFLTNPPKGTIEIVCHPEVSTDFEKVKKYF